MSPKLLLLLLCFFSYSKCTPLSAIRSVKPVDNSEKISFIFFPQHIVLPLGDQENYTDTVKLILNEIPDETIRFQFLTSTEGIILPIANLTVDKNSPEKSHGVEISPLNSGSVLLLAKAHLLNGSQITTEAHLRVTIINPNESSLVRYSAKGFYLSISLLSIVFQIIRNYRLRSTAGVSSMFIALNLQGFSLYLIYTVSRYMHGNSVNDYVNGHVLEDFSVHKIQCVYAMMGLLLFIAQTVQTKMYHGKYMLHTQSAVSLIAGWFLMALYLLSVLYLRLANVPLGWYEDYALITEDVCFYLFLSIISYRNVAQILHAEHIQDASGLSQRYILFELFSSSALIFLVLKMTYYFQLLQFYYPTILANLFLPIIVIMTDLFLLAQRAILPNSRPLYTILE